MKKILGLLFLGSTVLLLSCSLKNKNDLKKTKLFGKVKSVKERLYNDFAEKFGKIELGRTITTSQL